MWHACRALSSPPPTAISWTECSPVVVPYMIKPYDIPYASAHLTSGNAGLTDVLQVQHQALLRVVEGETGVLLVPQEGWDGAPAEGLEGPGG